jgi:hypothetical protein
MDKRTDVYAGGRFGASVARKRRLAAANRWRFIIFRGVLAPAGDFSDLFSNYFARNPKVPHTAAVKESEAAKGERKIVNNILKITLKFLAMLPLKVHQA